MPFFSKKNFPPVAFPASKSLKCYYQLNTQTVGSSNNSPTLNRIGYFPYYIKKDIENPTFFVQSQASGTAITVQFAVYNGENGFKDAPLLFNDSISVGASAAIYETQVFVNLKKGFYIFAGVNPVSSRGFRAGVLNASIIGDFGLPYADRNTWVSNQFYYYEAWSGSFPSKLGTTSYQAFSVSSGGLWVAIKY